MNFSVTSKRKIGNNTQLISFNQINYKKATDIKPSEVLESMQFKMEDAIAIDSPDWNAETTPKYIGMNATESEYESDTLIGCYISVTLKCEEFESASSEEPTLSKYMNYTGNFSFVISLASQLLDIMTNLTGYDPVHSATGIDKYQNFIYPVNINITYVWGDE